MYRLFTHLMLHDTWNYLRRQKLTLIIYTGVTVLTFWEIVQMYLIIGEEQINHLTGKSGMIGAIIIAWMLIWPFLAGAPLRICRGVYVCPVDERGKVKYLKGLLGIKVGVGLIVILIMEIAFLGIDGLKENWCLLLEIIGLSVFTLLSVSLNIGIGEKGKRQTDEQGYVIQSKEEIIVKFYWLCGLILQWIFLFTTTLNIPGLNERVVAGICVVLFGINLFVVFRYVGKFLREILHYEDVYRQKPKGNEVIYDI